MFAIIFVIPVKPSLYAFFFFFVNVLFLVFIILDVENSEIKIEKNKISSAKSLYDWNEK